LSLDHAVRSLETFDFYYNHF